MNVSATSGSSAYTAVKDTSQAEADRVNLGKDDFLKLLLTELRYQNALRPVDDKEMLAQMAQFSTLEQMQNLTVAMEGLAAMQHAMQAAALIGKTIAATLEDGETVTGTVSSVKLVAGVPYLVVDGKEVLLSQVSAIS